ncbi:MAG: hypothetical protein JXA78_03790 [Anaerolineales bacterium]|nr:hypothetical protein [Anaerolineales bacterium]
MLPLKSFSLWILNISNPAALDETLFFVDTTEEFAWGVAVAGNYAYVANQGGQGGGLQVVDISNPAAPVEVGSYYLPDALGVAVAGDRIYMAAGSAGLYILHFLPYRQYLPLVAQNWT